MNSWKLADPVAADTQAIVASGYGSLGAGAALFVELPERCGGAWLEALMRVAPPTAAAEVGGGASLERGIALAFTYSGLQRMQLKEAALASFSRPFREGMFQEDRLRRLGDRRSGEWLDTTNHEPPRWSGNTAAPTGEHAVAAYDVTSAKTEPPVATGLSVHALVLVYARQTPLVEEIEAVLAAHEARVVHRLPLLLDPNEGGISKEHFGFADGLSQPLPFDPAGAVLQDGSAVTRPHPINGVPLGEILIGYENGHQEIAPGPVAPGDFNGEPDPRPRSAGLPAHDKAQGFFDLGRNGSYLVVRELSQDVAAFWRSMETAADAIRTSDPDASHATAEWLAARVVGRDQAGHVLTPGGVRPPAPAGAPDNDFLFWDDDRHGIGCPMGAHIRRANPRDALAPKDTMKDTLLSAANNHRILRRGRKYGPNLTDRTQDDGAARGLLFMCLNTDIERQFEFVQQTWLLNSDFGALFEEVDPLVGPDGWMTIPQEPLRRRVKVETFVHMKGGEYFFLPSLPALRYLALL